MHQYRKLYNRIFGGLSIVFAILSIGVAFGTVKDASHNCQLGILAFWAIFPPIFFWIDWVWFCQEEDREVAKHTHDLSRNIWLGLLGILVAAFGVHLP